VENRPRARFSVKLQFLEKEFLKQSSTKGGIPVTLTRNEAKTLYAIIRHNVRTYVSAGIVDVIQGKTNAEATVKQFELCQSSEDRHEGWRYFLEQTEIKPGTDLAVATSMRQKELELRESQAALHEPVPASFRHS
jgi:hypothetical protein